MIPSNDQYSDEQNDERLVLRKMTGRKRNIDNDDAKNHFIQYFTKRLTGQVLDTFLDSTKDFDNCNFNDLSYEILTNKQYQSWSKCWSSYNIRTNGEKKYLYYLSENTHQLIEQISKDDKFKGKTINKIIQSLIMNEIIRQEN